MLSVAIGITVYTVPRMQYKNNVTVLSGPAGSQLPLAVFGVSTCGIQSGRYPPPPHPPTPSQSVFVVKREH
jgi:hypothetical protein